MKPYRSRLAMLVFGALAATAATAVAFPNPLQWFGQAPASPTAQPHPPAPSAGTALPVPGGAPVSFAPIAAAARPAVVNVSSTQTVRAQGGPQLGPGQRPFGEQDPFSEFFRHFFPHLLPKCQDYIFNLSQCRSWVLLFPIQKSIGGFFQSRHQPLFLFLSAWFHRGTPPSRHAPILSPFPKF